MLLFFDSIIDSLLDMINIFATLNALIPPEAYFIMIGLIAIFAFKVVINLF